MNTVAKVFAILGTIILLGAGACFVWVGESLFYASGVNTFWIIGTVLIVGGVIATIAILGSIRKNG